MLKNTVTVGRQKNQDLTSRTETRREVFIEQHSMKSYTQVWYKITLGTSWLKLLY